MKNVLLTFMLCCMFIPLMHAQNLENAKDHPLVKPFTGSTIKSYFEQSYIEYVAALELPKPKVETETLTFPGKLTSITYEAPENKGVLEVFRNYENALKRKGFKSLFVANKDVNAGIQYRYFLRFENGTESPRNHYALLKNDRNTFRYGVFKKGNVLIIVSANKGSRGEGRNRTYVAIDIVEGQEMEDGQVEVNADEIKDALDQDGKIALYGIYFDTGKATLKEESNTALQEVGLFLTNNPGISLYVVGHTDDTGSFESNQTLSEARAKAVTQALQTNYNISADRLQAIGVGPAAPVASNQTDEGKGLNRRVELVRRLK